LGGGADIEEEGSGERWTLIRRRARRVFQDHDLYDIGSFSLVSFPPPRPKGRERIPLLLSLKFDLESRVV
jgi:hypothetical protein